MFLPTTSHKHPHTHSTHASESTNTFHVTGDSLSVSVVLMAGSVHSAHRLLSPKPWLRPPAQLDDRSVTPHYRLDEWSLADDSWVFDVDGSLIMLPVCTLIEWSQWSKITGLYCSVVINYIPMIIHNPMAKRHNNQSFRNEAVWIMLLV